METAMEIVHLNLKSERDNSYDIVIGSSILGKIPSDLRKSRLGNKYLIIADSNTKKLFGEKLLAEMKKEGLNAEIVSFRAGEQSKSLSIFKKLVQHAHNIGLDRKSAILALGGGVVGDIGGFVAACYMRGIGYVQIPTSLLAMADSSIGGKTAVNLPTGKNIVGNFYQPKKTYIDVSLLKSLPERELLSGLSEAIKHSLIRDKSLFDFIEQNLRKIIDKDEQTLIRLIKRNCEIKAEIVERDEKESGLRKLLNYGHTIGHALETLTGYKKYLHGEAVAIGIAAEGLIANKLGMLSKEELSRQNSLIKKAGLPVCIPDIPSISSGRLIRELRKDKKAVDGRIEFVLLERIGNARYGINAPDGIIAKAIDELREDELRDN